MQGNKDHKNLSNMQGFKEENPDLTLNKSFEIHDKTCHLFVF